MNRIEAEQILKNEGLNYYNWFNEHEIRPNEVIISQKDGQWIVCAADERAYIVDTSYSYYKNEGYALDNFIKLVRLEKISM